MFDNIGGKIKGLARIICWAGIIGSILGGIVMISEGSHMWNGDGLVIGGIALAVAGSLTSWAGCFVLYGLGELIETNQEIVRINRGIALHFNAEQAARPCEPDSADSNDDVHITINENTAAAPGVNAEQETGPAETDPAGSKDAVHITINENTAAAAGRADSTAVRKAGETITLGAYPQTKTGTDTTPIEWTVLDVQGTRALLVSRFGLDAQPYNTDCADITWEKCTLRTWLNGTFMNRAFSTSEQNAILTATVDNSQSQCFYLRITHGGNNTLDRLFLLSFTEAKRYLEVSSLDSSNTRSCVQPTEYAAENGAYPDADNNSRWWLRSPGQSQSSAALVKADGSLGFSSAESENITVRPALWVNLEADIFKS